MRERNRRLNGFELLESTHIKALAGEVCLTSDIALKIVTTKVSKKSSFLILCHMTYTVLLRRKTRQTNNTTCIHQNLIAVTNLYLVKA
jgi:hypothetical protein